MIKKKGGDFTKQLCKHCNNSYIDFLDSEYTIRALLQNSDIFWATTSGLSSMSQYENYLNLGWEVN